MRHATCPMPWPWLCCAVQLLPAAGASSHVCVGYKNQSGLAGDLLCCQLMARPAAVVVVSLAAVVVALL